MRYLGSSLDWPRECAVGCDTDVPRRVEMTDGGRAERELEPMLLAEALRSTVMVSGREVEAWPRRQEGCVARVSRGVE